MGLEINRQKTRVVELKQKGASLDFLGFTFRWERSQMGPGHYWNLYPSAKSLERERAKLRELTSGRHSYWPIPRLIGELNQHLKGERAVRPRGMSRSGSAFLTAAETSPGNRSGSHRRVEEDP
jgi:hypothetical protein